MRSHAWWTSGAFGTGCSAQSCLHNRVRKPREKAEEELVLLWEEWDCRERAETLEGWVWTGPCWHWGETEGMVWIKGPAQQTQVRYKLSNHTPTGSFVRSNSWFIIISGRYEQNKPANMFMAPLRVWLSLHHSVTNWEVWLHVTRIHFIHLAQMWAWRNSFHVQAGILAAKVNTNQTGWVEIILTVKNMLNSRK